MSDPKREQPPQFFTDIQSMASAHGVVAYVVVAVVPRDQKFFVASGAASRLDEENSTTKTLYLAMEQAFGTAMSALAPAAPKPMLN